MSPCVNGFYSLLASYVSRHNHDQTLKIVANVRHKISSYECSVNIFCSPNLRRMANLCRNRLRDGQRHSLYASSSLEFCAPLILYSATFALIFFLKSSANCLNASPVFAGCYTSGIQDILMAMDLLLTVCVQSASLVSLFFSPCMLSMCISLFVVPSASCAHSSSEPKSRYMQQFLSACRSALAC